MIKLSVNDYAELSGFTVQHVRRLCANGSLNCYTDKNMNNHIQYLIPISELTPQQQLKYYKSHNIEIPEELLAGRKPKAQHPRKEFDEFSAEQREEIAEWIRIINA